MSYKSLSTVKTQDEGGGRAQKLQGIKIILRFFSGQRYWEVEFGSIDLGLYENHFEENSLLINDFLIEYK